jgi:DNA-directed RNA polymerase specialized sigma24 family protein
MTADCFRDDLTALLPRLWRYAMVLYRNQDRTNDLVQATCERALSRWHQFQDGTRLDAWTITILQSIWKTSFDAILSGAAKASSMWNRLD